MSLCRLGVLTAYMGGCSCASKTWIQSIGSDAPRKALCKRRDGRPIFALPHFSISSCCQTLAMPHDAYRFTTPQPWDKQPGLWVITTLSVLFSLLAFAGRWTIRRQFSSPDITLGVAYVRRTNLWPYAEQCTKFWLRCLLLLAGSHYMLALVVAQE